MKFLWSNEVAEVINTKGQTFTNNEGGLRVLILCIASDYA